MQPFWNHLPSSQLGGELQMCFKSQYSPLMCCIHMMVLEEFYYRNSWLMSE